MKFNLANKAPIGVTVDGKDYLLPRVRRPFWVAWAAEIDAAREERATRDLTPVERSKMLLIYELQPTSHGDLKSHIFTPNGTGRIVRHCAEQAGMPKEQIERMLDDGNEKDLETLALLLSSIVDTVESPPPPPAQEGEAKADDPLARTPSGSGVS
jgi:hypothetical protein